jgi:hypothetical protein
MMQRKLTREELQHANRAAWYLRSVMNHCGLIANGGSVLDYLNAMEEHGTTDGKPYIEPQPEIGEGYRPAMTEDVERRDRQQWNPQDLAWYYAPTGIHAGNITYRVPVDRIPTDEDARQRPTVMMRAKGDAVWYEAILIGVLPDAGWPFCGITKGGSYSLGRQCRFPYPGELD